MQNLLKSHDDVLDAMFDTISGSSYELVRSAIKKNSDYFNKILLKILISSMYKDDEIMNIIKRKKGSKYLHNPNKLLYALTDTKFPEISGKVRKITNIPSRNNSIKYFDLISKDSLQHIVSFLDENDIYFADSDCQRNTLFCISKLFNDTLIHNSRHNKSLQEKFDQCHFYTIGQLYKKFQNSKHLALKCDFRCPNGLVLDGKLKKFPFALSEPRITIDGKPKTVHFHDSIEAPTFSRNRRVKSLKYSHNVKQSLYSKIFYQIDIHSPRFEAIVAANNEVITLSSSNTSAKNSEVAISGVSGVSGISGISGKSGISGIGNDTGIGTDLFNLYNVNSLQLRKDTLTNFGRNQRLSQRLMKYNKGGLLNVNSFYGDSKYKLIDVNIENMFNYYICNTLKYKIFSNYSIGYLAKYYTKRKWIIGVITDAKDCLSPNGTQFKFTIDITQEIIALKRLQWMKQPTPGLPITAQNTKRSQINPNILGKTKTKTRSSDTSEQKQDSEENFGISMMRRHGVAIQLRELKANLSFYTDNKGIVLTYGHNDDYHDIYNCNSNVNSNHMQNNHNINKINSNSNVNGNINVNRRDNSDSDWDSDSEFEKNNYNLTTRIENNKNGKNSKNNDDNQMSSINSGSYNFNMNIAPRASLTKEVNGGIDSLLSPKNGFISSTNVNNDNNSSSSVMMHRNNVNRNDNNPYNINSGLPGSENENVEENVDTVTATVPLDDIRLEMSNLLSKNNINLSVYDGTEHFGEKKGANSRGDIRYFLECYSHFDDSKIICPFGRKANKYKQFEQLWESGKYNFEESFVVSRYFTHFRPILIFDVSNMFNKWYKHDEISLDRLNFLLIDIYNEKMSTYNIGIVKIPNSFDRIDGNELYFRNRDQLSKHTGPVVVECYFFHQYKLNLNFSIEYELVHLDMGYIFAFGSQTSKDFQCDFLNHICNDQVLKKSIPKDLIQEISLLDLPPLEHNVARV